MTDAERTVHNERTKLLATYFNNLAVALIAVGALAPVVGTTIGSSAPLPIYLLASAFVCLLSSVALHYAARRALERLMP